MTIGIVNTAGLVRLWFELRCRKRTGYNHQLSVNVLAAMATDDLHIPIRGELISAIARELGYRTTIINERTLLNVSMNVITYPGGWKDRKKVRKKTVRPLPISAKTGEQRTSKALPAGKRISKTGKVYHEYRSNRASYPVKPL